MKQSRSVFAWIFAAVMMLCVAYMIWYVAALSNVRFRLQDVGKSIETSRGRERKQQHEYDETVAEIPVVQAEIDRITPLADEAKRQVQALKAERKQLREEKKKLDSESGENAKQEADGDE